MQKCLFVRGPARYSPDVVLKLIMDLAKIWKNKQIIRQKYCFFHIKKIKISLIYIF